MLAATRRDRQLAGPARRVARVAVLGLAVAGLAGYAAALPAAYRRAEALDPYLVSHPDAVRAGLAEWGLSTSTFAIWWLAGITAIAVVFVGVGVLVVLRRPDDPAALLFAGVLTAFGTMWPNTVPAPGWPAPVAAAAGILGVLAFVGFFGLPFYFPDGRFVPAWSRWAFAVLAAHVVISEGLLLLADIRIPAVLDVAAVLGWVVAGVWAQVHRYRRVSTAAQRQQTKWAAAALITAIGGFAAVAAFGGLPVFASPRGAVVYAAVQMFAFGLLFCLVPLAVARAVLRHRLWDIDPLLNRTMVYGGLTAALTAVYAGIVAWVGQVVDVRGVPVASFVAAGAVAVLFEPLRRRLQGWANRLTYGQRDDPYRALTALARRLEQAAEPAEVLPLIARSVRRALRSPYAAIVDPDGGVLAAGGRPAADPLTVPLTHQGESLGALLVAPRTPGDRFEAGDRRLLADLAGQTAAALHTVRLQQRAARLAVELQASRRRLVTAREEERRRVRRELHDGLGPTLAAQAMQVEVAHDLVRSRPDQAAALLREVLARSADAVAEVRRIARGLRPPALDELGLAGAVRQAAAELTTRVPIRVIAAELPALPAAVEVAAYAIVREALTNVVRHARARAAEVRLAVDGSVLTVDVLDDGRGLADAPAGVGTVSMRERARELGGVCTVSPRAGGGTQVSARLPLNPEGVHGPD